MERYDEWVNDAEHEAARQITGWWRQLDNPDEVARELITRIREEVPALVDPERFNAERRPLEILETILRDRRPEGGREAYTRLVRRIVEDARTGEQLPLRPWTAQVGDAMFRANTVVVEARTVSEACGLALEAANNNADGWKEGGEPSDSFIDAISPGRNVDPWESGWENVPNNYTQDHVMGDGDDDPGPGTPTAPPAKSPRTPPNDEGERAGAPDTRDDPGAQRAGGRRRPRSRARLVERSHQHRPRSRAHARPGQVAHARQVPHRRRVARRDPHHRRRARRRGPRLAPRRVRRVRAPAPETLSAGHPQHGS